MEELLRSRTNCEAGDGEAEWRCRESNPGPQHAHKEYPTCVSFSFSFPRRLQKEGFTVRRPCRVSKQDPKEWTCFYPQ